MAEVAVVNIGKGANWPDPGLQPRRLVPLVQPEHAMETGATGVTGAAGAQRKYGNNGFI